MNIKQIEINPCKLLFGKKFNKKIFKNRYFIDRGSRKLVVCYHTNWAQYRQGEGKFLPENIDANLCDMIIYSFAKLDGDRLEPFEWNDLSTGVSKGMYERTMDLKNQNPNLKISIAVGGWNAGSGKTINQKNLKIKIILFIKIQDHLVKWFKMKG